MEQDPILTLHSALAQADLLRPENKDPENFRKLLSTTEGQKKVYGFLSDKGLADIPYEAFVSQITAKKKASRIPLQNLLRLPRTNLHLSRMRNNLLANQVTRFFQTFHKTPNLS